MDIRFERDVSQNVALASWALWSATLQYDKTLKSERGIPFSQMFIVLPLSLHEPSAAIIKSKTMTEGSFYRALTDDRTLSVGLQQRLQNYSETTLKALNVSFSSKLLLLDRDALEVVPGRKTFPGRATDEIKVISNAAKRVGYWLAVTEFPVLCNLLRIRY
ncbi:MAG: DUF6521 family protein [Pirellulales bacterium]|nr:DUF6521 family protein [Pirellulales bacterium]